MQVFGTGSDTINTIAAATGVSQSSGAGIWYVCMTAGNWSTSQGGGVGQFSGTSGLIIADTWAVISATTPANGTIRYVSDVGKNGSLWIYNSTDVRWRPVNGVLSLFSTAIPFVLLPSSTTGVNGAVTVGTALPIAYPNGYFYLPAGKAYTASAAGWYYGTMASTTALTIFNNIYTSGIPTIPSSPTGIVDAGPGGWTQTTASDIQALSYTVQGGVMGLNGTIQAISSWGSNNTANAKTVKEIYGGSSAFTGSMLSVASGQHMLKMSNAGIANAQAIWSLGSFTGLGTSANTNFQLAINSATDQPLTTAMQLATATDYIINSGFLVELVTQ